MPSRARHDSHLMRDARTHAQNGRRAKGPTRAREAEVTMVAAGKEAKRGRPACAATRLQIHTQMHTYGQLWTFTDFDDSHKNDCAFVARQHPHVELLILVDGLRQVLLMPTRHDQRFLQMQSQTPPQNTFLRTCRYPLRSTRRKTSSYATLSCPIDDAYVRMMS